MFNAIHQTVDGKQFIPADVMESLSIKDVVEAELKGKTGDTPVALLVDYVLNKPAKKVFLTLAFRGRTDALPYFHNLGISDGDLPIDLEPTPSSSNVPGPSREVSNPDSSSYKSCTSPGSWEKRDCYDFNRDQWLFLAPVFSKTEFTYQLHKQCPVPVITVMSVPHGGLQGSVSEVELHPAHQQVLTKVLFSNPVEQ